MNVILENCLTLQISNPTREGLIRLNACEKALKDFLSLKITLEDLFDVLGDNGVDIDDYIDIIDNNLARLGL